MAVRSLLAVLLVVGCTTVPSDKKQQLADIEYRICVNELRERRPIPALASCLKALDLDPKHADNHYVLGFLYQGKQMTEKAVEHYRRAIELKPGFSEARNNLATVFIELGRYDEALKELDSALSNVLYATPDIAHANIGWIYFKKGKPDLAIKHLKTSLFTNSKSCKVYNNLGAVYDSMTRYDEARRSFELAIQHCPEYGEAHYRIGLLFVRLQRHKEAKESFAKCVRLLPDSVFGRECEKYAKLLE